MNGPPTAGVFAGGAASEVRHGCDLHSRAAYGGAFLHDFGFWRLFIKD